MPRLFELAASSGEGLLHDLAPSLRRNPIKLKVYRHIEEYLGCLPLPAWVRLKKKLVPLLGRSHPVRGWQQVFDVFNEAKAFAYLRRAGVTHLRFIPESPKRGIPTPDIEGRTANGPLFCEVKTINASDDEVGARRSGAARAIAATLDEGLFQKLTKTLEASRRQLATHSGAAATSRRVVFVVLNFDDCLHESFDGYLRQVQGWAPALLRNDEMVVFSVTPAFYLASVVPARPVEVRCWLLPRGDLRWEVANTKQSIV